MEQSHWILLKILPRFLNEQSRLIFMHLFITVQQFHKIPFSLRPLKLTFLTIF